MTLSPALPPAATPAAAHGPSNVPSNVPAALSSFVGRVREVSAVQTLLGATRLLTVVGPGGAGKTRLAREVAASAASTVAPDADGVWWVELASIAAGGSADDVLQAAGAAAGVPPATGGGGPGEALEAALADGRALVVLDNCEHVVDATARVVERLLRACPGLRVLATSREALGTEGEVAWQLPPLGRPALRPAAGAPATADALAGYDAVTLFVDRARAASPGFALTDATAPAVAEVCARLDGMPLAIELAAAAIPTLGVDGVAARLGDALGLLTRGRRTALPRHKTLRAVLDWSYALLDPAAQALLARLSVFRGAFTLDAAEAVGGQGPEGADLPGDVPVLEAFGRLAEHSLIDVREPSEAKVGGDAEPGGEPRYALLETVRQYGAECLRGTPDEPVAHRRHAAWVAQLAEAAGPGLWSPAHRRTAERLRPHLDDIRAALAWTTAPERAPDDVLLGARTAGTLGFFWNTSVPWEEGRRWVRLAFEAGERAGLGDRTRPVAVRLAFVPVVVFESGMASHMGDAATALATADRLTPLLESIDDDLAGLRAAGDPRWTRELADWDEVVAWGYTSLGDLRAQALVQLDEFDPAAAAAHSHAAFARGRTLRNAWHGTLLRGRYASVLSALGRHADAAAEWEATIAGFRAHDDPWMLSFALQGMAANALALGAHGDAARYAAEGAAVLRADPDPWFTARALDTLAAACAAAQDGGPVEARLRAAARLLGAAGALRRRFGLIVIDLDREHHAAARAAVERALDPDAFAEERAAGAALSLDAMIALATEAAALAPRSPAQAPAPRPAPVRRVDAAPAPRALRIDVLGGFAVWRDGRALAADDLPGGKVRELLLWLLLHPGGGTKEDVGLALWPDASASQLRSSFHFTLHHLRRALGDPRWVTFAGNAYALDRAPAAAGTDPGGALDADVDAVLAAAAALREGVRRAGARPEALAHALDAVALDAARAGLARYRGPLATATGPGAAAGDWAVAHADRVRGAWADGTALLGVVESAAGRHADAVAAFERVLAAEPLREGVHRALMQAYAAAGEPGRALAHYDALAALLAREVGAAPARETQALAERLRRGA
ncbi:hypothetical protein tb265_12770 [Gemmatimonadetes bacterium T265]|nr:hypothetical protein tb265_12770 [Gemmatimonadetes bacterium T265]